MAAADLSRTDKSGPVQRSHPGWSVQKEGEWKDDDHSTRSASNTYYDCWSSRTTCCWCTETSTQLPRLRMTSAG